MHGPPLRVGLVQLRSGRRQGPNIDIACGLIREAAASGAQLIATPEMTHMIEAESAVLLDTARPEAEDPGFSAFSSLAAELSVTLLVGSLAIRRTDGRIANRSFLFGPDGACLAHYDKIHMFDVDLPGGESYRESRHYEAGTRAVLARLPGSGTLLGLTICYDLRFPALYRALAQAGAQIIAVPAAFTRTTGEAHWHVLLRARAIETGCFVIAPAQGGRTEVGRETFGHSLVVSPWGQVVAEAGTDPTVIIADLDLAQVAEARGKIPALTLDRPFTLERAGEGPA
ncbi:MAG: carbon-nitrogen hydrolase family protein [Alphaproteobacteria bacterium]|nr:carbon-nitrogen hydrolase family protein [Alphaproteobacteria bacterium]